MNTKELREHVMMEVVPVSIRNEILALCDRVEELESDLKQYEWRPIETAPKDGRELLLWDSLSDIYTGRYNNCWYATISGCKAIKSQTDFGIEYFEQWPTHWIPLPQMPEDKWAW